jgi:LysR family cys regulon transcriptional activator
MRLEQLRYIVEIVRQKLIISAAAETLHVAQPGISKQVRLLEEELGVVIFARNRSRLIALTPAGERVHAVAKRMLADADSLKRIAAEVRPHDSGPLTVATTHSQALYALPESVRRYMERYPDVRLSVRQGTPPQIWRLLEAGEADIALSSAPRTALSGIAMFKCGEMQRVLLTPPRHPLLGRRRITLEELARYPIITYDDEFIGRSQVRSAFEAAGLVPNFVLSATDSDVMKAYVSLGLGVAVVASLAFDPRRDRGLRAVEASHLFKPNSVYIGVRRDRALPRYALEFVGLIAPGAKAEIERAVAEWPGLSRAADPTALP